MPGDQEEASTLQRRVDFRGNAIARGPVALEPALEVDQGDGHVHGLTSSGAT
jgi:hypothetical protein